MQGETGHREPSGASQAGPPGVEPLGTAAREPARTPGGEPPGTAAREPAGTPGGEPPGTAAREPAGRITRTAWYRRLDPHLHRVRSTPTGALAVRVVVTVFGIAVIIVGIVLLPLPGPGWLIIFLGLAILSLEYVWARHLLRYAMRQVRRWDDWVRARSLGVRIAIGVVAVAALMALAGVTLELSLGRGTLARWWEMLTP
jgi:uncharacterized protein (TIGR02611 family)